MALYRHTSFIQESEEPSLSQSSLSQLYNKLSEEDENIIVKVIGKVTKRRAFDSILFISLNIDDNICSSSNNKSRKGDIENNVTVQLVLSSDNGNSSDVSMLDTIKQICSVGCSLCAIGEVKKGGLSNIIDMKVMELKLLTCSPTTNAVERLIHYVREGSVSRLIACQALCCDELRLDTLLSEFVLTSTNESSVPVSSVSSSSDNISSQGRSVNSSKRSHEFVVQARAIQGLPPKRSRQRKPQLHKSDIVILNNIQTLSETLLYPCRLCTVSDSNGGGDGSDGGGQGSGGGLGKEDKEDDKRPTDKYDVNIPNGLKLDDVSSRGHMTRGDYIHGRKLPQCDWFVQQIGQMKGPPKSKSNTTLKQIDDEIENTSNVKVSFSNTKSSFHHVLDVGGGRGDLGMHIASSYPNMKITVVDVNDKSLQAGKICAEKRGLSERMQFIHQDFVKFVESLNTSTSTTSPSSLSTSTSPSSTSTSSSTMPKIDLVVALHACGGLTDLALQCAMKLQCAFLICPCCYLKHQNLCSSKDKSTWKYTYNTLTGSQTKTGTSQLESHSGAAADVSGAGTADVSGAAATAVADEDDVAGNVSVSGPVSNPKVSLVQREEEMRIVMRLCESDDRNTSFAAMTTVNKLRLSAVCEEETPTQSQRQQTLSIRAFPKSFSLRNLVIAGEYGTLGEASEDGSSVQCQIANQSEF